MKYTFLQQKLLIAADKVLNGIISLIGKTLPDGPSFTDEREEKYEIPLGDDVFLTEPKKDFFWSLGYGSRSLVPTDWETHQYFIGGYFMPNNNFFNSVEKIYDDMRVRAISLDDNSGRGISVFAVVDSIGIAGGDIREICHEFQENCSALFPDVKVCTVNICSTHTHSCIDTEGLWTGGMKRIFKSFSPARKKKLDFVGIDPRYRKFLFENIVSAMLTAVNNMEKGTMKYCAATLDDGYFVNKNRPSASSLDTSLTRLIFTPDNPSKRKTVIAFLAAHPDVAGMPVDEKNNGRLVSGDYIYYMEKVVNCCDDNFLMFNGSIAGIYMARNLTNDNLPMQYRAQQSERYGTEMGRLLMSMGMQRDEVYDKMTDEFSDKCPFGSLEKVNEEKQLAEKNGGGYTFWLDSHKKCDQTEVKPVLNIKKELVEVKVENPIIILAGKLGLANFAVIRHLLDTNYAIRTQIGYMEIGDNIRLCMVPGEYCQDLLLGGSSLTKETSFWKKGYSLPSLKEIFGDKLLSIGLCNDEIGYIVPDNDYVLSDFKNHYHEELSLGKNTASYITRGFLRLKAKIKYDR